MEVPGLRPHSSRLYTILAELYSNALEHGVLGLSSRLKSSSDGFGEYYAQRSLKLMEFGTVGYTTVKLSSKKSVE